MPDEKIHRCPAGRHDFYCPTCNPDGMFAPHHMKDWPDAYKDRPDFADLKKGADEAVAARKKSVKK